MKRFLAPLALAPLLLSGCIKYNIGNDGTTRLRIGETATVAPGVTVTPLSLLEDSRCASGVQCVWAGQVRVSVRVTSGGTSDMREFISAKSQSVGSTTVTLSDVWPAKQKGVTIFPDEYRFGFTVQR